MGFKYKADNPEGIYFITTSIVQWIDLFTRKELQDVVIESLKYCQYHKGLVIFAWTLMPSHLHLIAAVEGEHALSDIMRDLKKYSSKTIVKTIEEINESRKNWLLIALEFAGRTDQKIKDYRVWQQGYHPEELVTNKLMNQKLDYIHNNAVEAGFVTEPHHYALSSAINYAGGKGLIDVTFLE